ncbi:hypothetical protein FA95DRAFT_531703 [Auriscalpium vulgare]|uniref:Uncharacterized protein n=1 Tax=Auriscalpium vulgare TaxID=40419 RepID=A0ACB8RF83_9AGAM|nr:hypothetical protein FA95DRAFT_531703 [Auriscalpium vulgare]
MGRHARRCKPDRKVQLPVCSISVMDGRRSAQSHSAICALSLDGFGSGDRAGGVQRGTWSRTQELTGWRNSRRSYSFMRAVQPLVRFVFCGNQCKVYE